MEIEKHPQLLDLGFYHRLLTPYYDWFPKEHIWVWIYEEFFEDEERGCTDLFRFLGIDDGVRSSYLGKRVNASTENRTVVKPYLRSAVLRLLNAKCLIPVKELLHTLKIDALKMDYKGIDKSLEDKHRRPILEQSIKNVLLEEFDADIHRLEGLLGRKLDIWMK